MAMNLDALLRIKADVQGENNIRRLGNSLQGLQGQAKNAALGFNNLKGAVAGFGAAIAGSAIVAGLGAIVKKSIDAGDELFNLQAKSGVAATALIGIGNAAKLADVDMGTLGKGLTKLNVNLVKAAEGNEDLARKFQALGVDVKDANGQVVPADKALKQIADRFADMPDGAQKAAAAVALFGKAGTELIPLLNEGAASMEKFTYKVGEDFAARSDLFNDTITELGIKTQGFGLELTDALLPALQSILEVFSDLFDTDQDWTALFKVIEGVIRGLAVAIYTVVKAVDILIKNIVAAAQAASQAFAGDFGAAFKTITTRVSSGFAEAKQGIADLNKLAFGSAASPGTGRRTGGRNMELDTSKADKDAAAAARKREADAKRAATEQERLLEQRATLMKRGMDLQEQLRRSVQDVTLSTQVVTASPVKQLELSGQKAIIESARQVEDLRKNVRELIADFEKAGGSLDATPFFDLINQLSNANVALVNKTYQQDFAELYASQGEAIDRATESVYENARALQYNNDIMGGLKDGLKGYIEQIGTMRDALSNLGQQAFKGIEDALVSLVTTGTANFREFAVSILQETSRMIIQQLVLKQIMQAIGFGGGGGGGFLAGGGAGFTQFNASSVGFNPLAFSGTSFFANGGIMTGDGPMPLKKYASGGIANSPQLAMFGEGRKPEAFVPLPDGRRIPVAMQGGGGGTAVTVNVDASGSTVQGNSGQGAALGRAIAASVQAELVKQKRPGGLLA
jgi:lambda family phage tail tape measure protein